MPVFMAATPEFVEKSPDTVVAYLKAWLEVAKDFKESPGKVADVDLLLLHLEGLHHVAGHLRQGARARRGEAGLAVRPQALHARTRPKSC